MEEEKEEEKEEKKEEKEEEKEGEKEEGEEEKEEGQADFGPIDNLPMAGGSRSEVCFCLVKIDI